MMQTETVPIGALRPPLRNVRSHPEKQIVELARAVEMFGQTRPIVIDEDNTVLVGNGLVLACKRLGRSEVVALRKAGLSPAQKNKLMLSDNRLFELGLDDHSAILDTIRGLDGDFDIPGFDPELLKSVHLDVEEVTEATFENYGKLPDWAIAQARENELAPPVAGEPPSSGSVNETAPAPAEVVCPNCHKPFHRP